MCTDTNVTDDICKKLNLSKKEFLNFLTQDNLRKIQTGEINAEELWKSFSENSGLTVESDYFYDYFNPKRRQGMYDVIEKIKSKGYRVVLGTNTIDSHYQKHTNNGDYDIFEKVYPSNLIGYAKPDPNFLQYILKAENVEAENAVFVDDSAENINSANLLGIHTILFDSFENVKNKIDLLIE